MAMILIGSYLFYKTPVNVPQILGVLITIVGVIIVSTAGDVMVLTNLMFNHGDLLMLIAVVLYAAYTLGPGCMPHKARLRSASVNHHG